MDRKTSFFKEFKRGFADFLKNISVFSNLLLLLLVYFLGVGLTFFIAKLAGKNFLNLRPDKEAATYWEKRDQADGNYYRQF